MGSVQILYSAGQEEINSFCGNCDYRDNRDACPESDQTRYVARDWCGWSSMEGVKLGPVTKTLINVGGVEFPRDNPDGIAEALTIQKQKESRE
jgi:hypothetical protein